MTDPAVNDAVQALRGLSPAQTAAALQSGVPGLRALTLPSGRVRMTWTLDPLAPAKPPRRAGRRRGHKADVEDVIGSAGA